MTFDENMPKSLLCNRKNGQQFAGRRVKTVAWSAATFAAMAFCVTPAQAGGPPALPAMAPLIAAAFADVTTLVLVPALGPVVIAAAINDAPNLSTVSGFLTPLHGTQDLTALALPAPGQETTLNGSVTISAKTETTLVTVGLLINLDLLFGTADEGVTATTEVTGVGLGDGGVNYLTNNAVISATANANVSSGNVDINLVELEKVDANILATAIATGIAGGAFRDVILNDAAVTAIANADAAHFDGEFNILNTTSGEMNVAAQATATGIDGKAGNDVIINTDTITATADAEADLTSVTLTIGDAAITDLSVFEASGDTAPTSQADAIGIDGGSGADVVINSGTINASANVDVDTVTIGVTGFGVADAGTIAGIFSAEPQVDAETAAQATATGIEGGTGADRLANTGTINATATSDAQSVGVTVAMPVPNLPTPLSFLPGFNIIGVGTGDDATAYGMSGGEGNDFIGNEGDVTATATSNSLAVSVGVELPDLLSAESDDPTISTSFSITDAATESDAIATALLGGMGNDTLINLAGTLTASAASDSQTTAVSVIVTEGGTGFTGRLNAARTSVVSTATATGMDGGEGNDTMANSGTLIDVDADADADNLSVTAQFTYSDDPGSVLISVTGMAGETEATANAVGIRGGAGNDAIDNDAAIDADALANAMAVVVSVAFNFNKDTGLAAGVQLLDTDVTANAISEGVSGGDGNDIIDNSGAIDADATANATGTVVSLNIAGSWDKGASIGVSVADTTTNANAEAIGIYGGAGDDDIRNTATLDASATADANSLGVSATLSMSKDTGFAAGVTALRTGAFAEAEAYGIAGGDGADTIFNQADITATADAESDATAVGVTVAFTKTGASLGASLVDAQTMSTAVAAGIIGDVLDRIDSTGTLDVTATADASSNAISTSFAITSSAGLAGGAALARAGTVADATATGIVGGGLADTLTATGTSDIIATANTASVGVGVSVSGTKTGVALGVSLVDTATVGTATATGLSGNEGEDILSNTGTLNSTATVDADSTGVSVSITAAMQAGVSAGAALGRATGEAHAFATGIEGGADNDTISNTGTVNAIAAADIDSTGVSVAISGTSTGVSLSAALSDTSAIAEAIAKGLFGGWGNDIISSTGALIATSTADAAATTASVSVGVAATGVAVGVSMARSETEASADAVGIDGGHGRDTITTSGTIDSTATADADGASVAVTITASAKGASAGAAFSDVGVSADASAAGIRGGDEAGAPDTPGDTIMNNAVINSDAIADVTGTSVGVTASVSFVPLGFTQVNAAADATATSVGIDGGLGADLIANMNSVTADALAGVVGTAVGVTLAIGATLGDLTATADATATGIDGGEGEDEILNTSTVAANATATGTGVSIGIAMIGAALTDSSTTSTATATGIDGGEDDDIIDNQGAVGATSNASVVGVSVSIAPTGASLSDGSSTAKATSTGIDGGEGNDEILNQSTVTSDATATATGVSISVTMTGGAISDLATEANAMATGIGGGGGNDIIDNRDTIDATSSATVTGVSVSAVHTGASLGDSTSHALATSYGIGGGAGNDVITNSAALNVLAAADGTGVTVSISGAGAALADGTTTTTASANGIAGDAGEDTIVNTGAMDIDATADVIGVTVTLTVAGAAIGDLTSKSEAEARGIDGGDDDDLITNDATVDLNADADATGVSISVTVAGAAIAEASSSANAVITGISGGAGNDIVLNLGTIIGTADGTATGTSVSVGLFGAALGDLSTTSAATAVGIEGNDGDDRLENAGTIDIDADANGGSTSVGVTLVGGAVTTDLVTLANALVTGMSGGAGRDTLINSLTIDIGADADSNATAVSVGLIGGALSGGGTRSEATAVGFDGGDEADIIVNSGDLTANASARADAIAVSVSLAGYAATEGALSARATVYGAAAGDGDDEVLNTGSMNLDASATTDVDGTSVSIVGATDNSPKSDAAAVGVGLDGGAGNNMLINRGTITLDTVATMDMNNAGFTFAGSSTAEGFLEANVSAAGMQAEDGDDLLANEGTLTITATANLTSTGDSTAAFGSSSAGDSTLAVASAFGLDGGNGANMFLNAAPNTITVTATTNITANQAAYTFGGGSASDSVLTSRSNAIGIRGGSGVDLVQADGTLIVTSEANLNSTGSSNSTFGGSSSQAGMSAQTTGGGIETGGAADIVVITGTVAVVIDADGNVDNTSSTGVGLFNDVTAKSDVTISGSGFGVSLGSGDNQLANSGLLSVTVGGTAFSRAEADGGDAIGLIDGDARARAESTANGFSAVGIAAGNGNNIITNDGNLFVVVQPAAEARSDADGDGIDGDGDADSIANANNATAVGIDVGHGDNFIVNGTGALIDVLSSPLAKGRAESDGDLGGSSNADTNFHADNALAIGVRTGNGMNTVINEGTIFAHANPSTQSAVSSNTVPRVPPHCPFHLEGDPAVIVWDCPAAPPANSSETGTTNNARAFGIVTGDDDDIIENWGSIEARVTIGVVVTHDVGIQAGAGNDIVRLGDGSSVLGRVDLGSGADTLHLIGTPTVSGIIAGTGSDNRLIFEGAGFFGNDLGIFVGGRATKTLPGTYEIRSLPNLARLRMENGTLLYDNLGVTDYTMDDTDVFEVRLDRIEGGGAFSAAGTVIDAGEIIVEKGPHAFAVGDSFDVVLGTSVVSFFATETLPATPLLDFTVIYDPTVTRIAANVHSFGSVLSGSDPYANALGDYLNRILGSSTGDLAKYLGLIQNLPAGTNFDALFNSLSGNVYDLLAIMQRDGAISSSQMHHARMVLWRAVADRFGPGAGQPAFSLEQHDLNNALVFGNALGQAGSTLGSSARIAPWFGVFGNATRYGAGRSGDLPFASYSRGWGLGADVAMGNGSIGGFSYVEHVTDGEVDAGRRASGDIATTTLTGYGSFMLDPITYLEADFSFGTSDTHVIRHIGTGVTAQTAVGQFDSSIRSVHAEIGRAVADANARAEFFASLRYTVITDDAHTETGAGPVSLVVAERRSEFVQSELGMRLGLPIQSTGAVIVPRAHLSWIHDFQADRREISAGFVSTPGTTFTHPGRALANETIKFGAGVHIMSNDTGVESNLNVEAVMREGSYGVTGTAQINLRF